MACNGVLTPPPPPQQKYLPNQISNHHPVLKSFDPAVLKLFTLPRPFNWKQKTLTCKDNAQTSHPT